MANANRVITSEQFYLEFKPQPNPFEEDAAWDGSMLETYGEEFNLVTETFKTHPDRVWTVLDADGEIICANGMNFVNRMGYIITEVAVPPNTFITVEDCEAQRA